MLAYVLAALITVQGRLPVERVTTARGLVNDRITHIVSDSRGYLWFGTRDGVSRYDGQRFVNYTTDDGLPGKFITTMIEARGGTMYIATATGLARLDPHATRGKQLFTVIARDVTINDVVQDANGRVWAGCDDTLCEVRGNALERVASYDGGEVLVLAPDQSGQLWVGTHNGIRVRRTGGTWDRYVVAPHRGGDGVHGLSFDPRGRLWIGNGFGVFIAEPHQIRSPIGEHAPFTPLTTPDAAVVFCRTAIHARGVTWVPTSVGLVRFDANGPQWLDERAGLVNDGVNTIAEDAGGNLWFGADRGGALRVAPSDITTYTRNHGLRNDRVNSLIEIDGTLCATTDGTRFLECFEGNAVRTREIVPPSVQYRGWGWGNVVARDRNGELWVATAQGAVRWNRDLTRVIGIYSTRDGLGGDDVFRIWLDSRGDLWFSTFGARVLTRRDRATGRFVTYGESDGMPLEAPTAFAEDGSGNRWFGLYNGGVVRFDGKRFTRFDNVPKGFLQALLFDSRGTLWAAANEGIAPLGGTVRKPGAYSLAEMRDGRIAVGTTRGVALLDPKTGSSTQLTTADGLVQNEIIAMHIARDGALWLASPVGLSRVTHIAPRRAAVPPRPRIESIDGHVVPELGTHAAPPLRLEYPDHRVTITFSAPDFDPRHPLQFEYRLAGDPQWTPAGARRSVTYERLPFGEQRFEVRAAGGRESATVAMNVIPPLWRRWWFVAGIAALLAAAALLLHRMRVRHLLALQEMRMRVATDLHDDLGSSLSRISILSEVAKRRGNERVLDEIGDTARGLVDALGDSIWSIDPRRDDLQSVLARVRHFAADVLEAKSIAMDFDVPPSLAELQLTPEKRRELFLILKEAINNAAKHSGASRLAVAAHVEGSRLRVRIEDDGAGFAREHANGGHGLPSMTARAERTGGTLVIGSAPGAGTRIDVSIPV